MSLRTWCGAVACAVLMIFAPAARAQDWPNRSILAISTVSAVSYTHLTLPTN